MAFCKKCGKELKKGEKCSCEAEVKFCKNCGKKLVGNEVCDCVESKSSTNTANFDFVETMKDIKDDLFTALKKPVTVIKENTDTNNMPKTYIIIAILALTFGIFIASLCKSLIGLLLGTMTGGYSALIDVTEVMDAVQIPYFKIIIYGIIIFAIMAAAYALIMLLVPALFKNKKIDYKQGLTLTASAHLPLIWVNVICALLGFLGLSAGIVLVIYLVANMIVTYNFVYAYGQYTKVNDNKFGYAIAVLVVLSSLIVGICSYAISNSMTKSITQDMVDIDTDDLYDMMDY